MIREYYVLVVSYVRKPPYTYQGFLVVYSLGSPVVPFPPFLGSGSLIKRRWYGYPCFNMVAGLPSSRTAAGARPRVKINIFRFGSGFRLGGGGISTLFILRSCPISKHWYLQRFRLFAHHTAQGCGPCPKHWYLQRFCLFVQHTAQGR